MWIFWTEGTRFYDIVKYIFKCTQWKWRTAAKLSQVFLTLTLLLLWIDNSLLGVARAVLCIIACLAASLASTPWVSVICMRMSTCTCVYAHPHTQQQQQQKHFQILPYIPCRASYLLLRTTVLCKYIIWWVVFPNWSLPYFSK